MRNSNNRWRPVLSVVILLTGMLPVGWSGGGSSAEAAAPVKSTCASSTGTSWDQALSGSCRFTVLSNFGGAAVRDNETGLVWEQAPDTNLRFWNDNAARCANKAVGGRKGWRLPSVAELASLIDPSVATGGPTLPAGHPFTGVQVGGLSGYWSASALADNPGNVWVVEFFFGNVGINGKSGSGYFWCVRGPMQESVY